MITRFALSAGALALGFIAAPAMAQTSAAAVEAARKAVSPLYEMLNTPQTKDLKALAQNGMAPDWRSYSADGVFKTRDEFVATAGGIGKAVPDLKWEIKEVLVDGLRVIVRGEATGTPAGPFLGVPFGGKAFRIMSIDVHTLQDGRISTTYHVEDWASAMRQLSAK